MTVFPSEVAVQNKALNSFIQTAAGLRKAL